MEEKDNIVDVESFVIPIPFPDIPRGLIVNKFCPPTVSG